MKTAIQFILILIFSSCASKKSIERKGILENNFQNITEIFDAKKVNYIGLKKYCVGGIRIEMPNAKDCKNCYSENDIYIFWTEKGKSYVQKFDNCSEFNIVEILDFQANEFLKKYTLELQTGKVGNYKIDQETFSSVSHSCFRNYIINDRKTKYQSEFDIYNLTGETKNLNFKSNNELKIIQLDKKLNKIIKELENENQFERNKKTCYNNGYN
ncbi:hypothetical protein F0365_13905 [Nonlabens sp. Ci31]|uniref:hypothetical protein n=1 Tax=Nonlabens sp. Ci31 TaxID=2608253 RepID=UPI0014638811|nr:hypothetical protein [Nonlabens sp. Ci31]QJP35415.1 hypothetical protein F0365_13905 [Nonlabens sp. Ci31]